MTNENKWLRVGTTVYALNSHNINRFSMTVQGGFDDSSARTSETEKEDVARLIAAAPDLLAALKAFVAANQSFGLREGCGYEHVAAERVARDAIAKAEGRE